MPESEKKSLTNFQTKVRSLRSSNDFETLLEEIKDYLNLPENTNKEDMKAILIRATQVCYETTYMADAVLMALGLLKGYDNRDDKQGGYNGRKLLRERREKFIKENIYLEKIYGYSFDDLECGRAKNTEGGVLTIKTAISTLGTNDGNYIDKISEKIYSNSQLLLNYVNAHEKDYFNKVIVSKNKEEKIAILPSMSCPTRKKNTKLKPSGTSGGRRNSRGTSGGRRNSRGTSGSYTKPLNDLRIIIINFYNFLFIVPNVTNDKERHKKIKNTAFFLIGIVFLLAFLSNKVIEISIRPASNPEVTEDASEDNQGDTVPHVEKILISESEIFITPDLGAQIMAAVWPPGAYPSEPSFQSSNTDIVTVERDGELKAECSPAEGESYTATITIQAGKITEYITVTVFSSKDYPEAKEEPEFKPRDDIEKP